MHNGVTNLGTEESVIKHNSDVPVLLINQFVAQLQSSSLKHYTKFHDENLKPCVVITKRDKLPSEIS